MQSHSLGLGSKEDAHPLQQPEGDQAAHRQDGKLGGWARDGGGHQASGRVGQPVRGPHGPCANQSERQRVEPQEPGRLLLACHWTTLRLPARAGATLLCYSRLGTFLQNQKEAELLKLQPAAGRMERAYRDGLADP